MSDVFGKILPVTLTFEGGTTVDTGGLTHRGITQSTYDAYAKQNKMASKPVTNLNYGETKDFYSNEFYKKPKIDKLPERVQGVAFDYAVNSGAGQAVKTIQKIVGTDADGVIGKNTLKAIDEYVSKNGDTALASKIVDERMNHLSELISSNPQKYSPYAQGWANRINKLRDIYLTPKSE